MNAEILLFDGFKELDAMGPWQVLADLAGVSNDITARPITLEGPRPVEAHRGAVICAHGAPSERPDVLIVPGGGWLDRSLVGVRREFERGEIPAAIADRHAAGSTSPRSAPARCSSRARASSTAAAPPPIRER